MDFDKRQFPDEPSSEFFIALDLWRFQLPGLPSRIEAVEGLIDRGLTLKARDWVAKQPSLTP